MPAETGKFQSSQGRASASLSVVAVSLPWPCVKPICKFQAHMTSASVHTSVTQARSSSRTRVSLAILAVGSTQPVPRP